MKQGKRGRAGEGKEGRRVEGKEYHLTSYTSEVKYYQRVKHVLNNLRRGLKLLSEPYYQILDVKVLLVWGLKVLEISCTCDQQ